MWDIPSANQTSQGLVPLFEGDKTKFEDFWGLFSSPVDEGDEPVNVKMARLRQSLTGTALEAIRGLGVTTRA